MLNIDMGIKNRDVNRFNEYCDDNKILITYSRHMGTNLHVNVSIEAAKVEEFMDEFE